nr:recombinase family protein [Butyrivibrio sp.]
MPDIIKIPRIINQLKQKKRVAAYARVSMETELLLHSLEAQVSYYTEKIQMNPEWVFAGIYADEGISGTGISQRDGFQRLVNDCEAGKIDIVLVKSISRFARDTVDCLNTVRHLKNIGVEVRFERENISSFSSDGELLLTLLASFAQAESESISENIKWATRKRFARGIPNGHKAPYGYRWDGEMFRIIPEQGEVVKTIFQQYLSGVSGYRIAKTLKESGVRGQSGQPISESAIKGMISNISYTGTMILQKNYFNEKHKRKKNNGELPRYMVEEMFEPLVSREDFERAQEILRQRAMATPHSIPTKFSGLVRCGNCGAGVSRRTSKGKKKWICNTRERKSTCDMRTIMEAELEEAAKSVLGETEDGRYRRMVQEI